MTYHNPALGACGQINGDEDPVVAISHLLFDEGATPNPNKNPHCNRMIRAWRNGNAPIVVRVVDRCVRCKHDDIDVSPSSFAQLVNLANGNVYVQWEWA
ncbi:hypothetical protein K458DRAFT_389092 [Lentithecium fluviatile CBS 122367]|uniref:RlpA-like protein double-psi beta-barrel domain-containing protein n=1 Tax=Lentithecium fluviatile CBS 122367 TaxID=1168545 RepID=A0A6G1J343_9PLEO|nr:hypothetical protein K458DRAFT_389092 [Lentithecium fluviatile CBS 122367]